MTDRLKADLALVVVAAVWGGTFVMVKDALALVGPFTFLAVRFVFAAVAIAPAGLVGRRRRSSRLAWAGVAVGGFLFAGYALQTAGLQFTSASRAGFLTGLSVVIVPALSALLLRAVPGPPALGGVLLATVGLAMLSLDDPASAAGLGVGDLLVLGCAGAFAGHILLIGWFAPRHDAIGLTATQIVPAAILAIAAALLLESPSVAAMLGALPAALFTGLFATVGAFYIQTRAQRFTTATHTALIFSLEPVFAALFAFLIAGERLGGRELVGCGMILAGMVLAQFERRAESPAGQPSG